jgi:hypothetical protein
MGQYRGVSITVAMTAVGHSRPNWPIRVMSAIPLIATELRTLLVVRLVPKGDI